ncbi:thioesterase family protein [Aeromicrobium sp. YIM 150415]|uniref:thioesterase family protein n=1 Tax=Aeromicrobium sp. YIM 150415 TaxID=2803912 RepID=UPI001963D3E2|nr:thioesterase family protein [Aeromicrobium sp. YIM 150415]MBM9465551.1 thioesterase family protein [Aeromicrobium sp. YIM 150415]
MTDTPTIEQLDELGIIHRRTVPPEFEDLNGHVNVRHHYTLHMEGAHAVFADELGVDEERAARGEGTFSLSQYIRFASEILVGHDVSVHWRLLDRSDKIIHGMTILADRTTGKVASTSEFIEAFVDLNTRRVAPMPQDLADLLDKLLATHRELPWELPLSEPLAVRR